MSGFNRLLKNSISNIINGFSNIILGVVISPFLLKTLPLDDFSVWNLALQIGAFFSLISYACQMTVARYITSAKKKGNNQLEKDVMRKGLILSVMSMLFCLIIVFIFYNKFANIFIQIKTDFIIIARYCVAIVSVSFILGFVSSVFSGFFTGIERNDIPAIVNLISRILLGIIVIFVSSHGILLMSLTYLTINILSYIAMYIMYVKVQNIRTNNNSIDNIKFRKFIHYFIGMCGINLSSFLLIGINGVLVGKYAFSEYSYYSLSMVLVTAAVGFISSSLTPTMQPMIRFYDDQKRIDELLYNLTVFVSLFISMLLILITYAAPIILSLWVGHDIATKMFMLFIALIAINLTRLIGLPISLFYFAKAKQNKIIYLPFLEGIISIIFTIIFINDFGSYAVPLGLFIAVIIIFIIYSFKLLYIVGKKYRFFYKVLFLLYPITMIGYIFLNVKYALNNYIGLAVIIPLAILFFRKIKILKKILGN